MKKSGTVPAICFLVVLVLGCNLSTVTSQLPQGTEEKPTAEIVTVVDGTPAPTATAAFVLGATAGPTPTLASAADCPPFAFNSIAADFASLADASLFIGKHYNPAEYNAVFDGTRGEMLDEVHALEEFYKHTLSVEFLSCLVCHASDGKAYWEVKDAMILNLGPDQSIVRTCWAGQRPVQPVIAIGHVDLNQPEQVYQDTTGWRYDRMDSAYWIDLEREKFTLIPLEGLVCMQILEGGD